MKNVWYSAANRLQQNVSWLGKKLTGLGETDNPQVVISNFKIFNFLPKFLIIFWQNVTTRLNITGPEAVSKVFQ
jgi:hypothetical protein